MPPMMVARAATTIFRRGVSKEPCESELLLSAMLEVFDMKGSPLQLRKFCSHNRDLSRQERPNIQRAGGSETHNVPRRELSEYRLLGIPLLAAKGNKTFPKPTPIIAWQSGPRQECAFGPQEVLPKGMPLRPLCAHHPQIALQVYCNPHGNGYGS